MTKNQTLAKLPLVQDAAARQTQEPRMTRKSLLDSIPVTPPVTPGGKDPMRDLPIGGRRRRPTPPVPDQHERRLLAAFHAWLKWPKEPMYREKVSILMTAHEVRAYAERAQ